MVSLPVSRQTKSSTMARSSASVSPVFRSTRISTIMGTITSTQPERISDSVPSKSNKSHSWRARRMRRAESVQSLIRNCRL